MERFYYSELNSFVGDVFNHYQIRIVKVMIICNAYILIQLYMISHPVIVIYNLVTYVYNGVHYPPWYVYYVIADKYYLLSFDFLCYYLCT